LFNNNPDNEDDFCESYKSEILNNSSHETDSSLNTILKTLIILLLLAIIAGLSIYGYNYMSNKSEGEMPPSSVQISDDELKVTMGTPEDEVHVEKVETSLQEQIDESAKETTSAVEKPVAIMPPPSIQETSVAMPTSVQEQPTEEIEEVATSIPVPTESGELDIDEIANAMKLSIAADEEKKIDAQNEKLNAEVLSSPSVKVVEEPSLEVPSSSSPEAKYLEELAELSKEIDKDN